MAAAVLGRPLLPADASADESARSPAGEGEKQEFMPAQEQDLLPALRHVWVRKKRGEGDLFAVSRHLTSCHRVEDNSGNIVPLADAKTAPKADNALFLIFDILFTATINQAIGYAWDHMQQMHERTGGATAQTDWADILKFCYRFVRPIAQSVGMWMFVTLFLSWFHLHGKKGASRLAEYGDGGAVGGTMLLVPTMLCLLIQVYNRSTCIFVAMTSESSAHVWSNETSETPLSNGSVWKCGHAKDATPAVVEYFPAEPCTLFTWGSCVFVTVGQLTFFVMALAFIRSRWGALRSREGTPLQYERDAAHETLKVFGGTFVMQILLSVAVLIVEFSAYRQITWLGFDPGSLLVHWRVDAFLSMLVSVMVAWPYVCMIVSSCRQYRHRFLPLDSEHLTARFQSVLKVGISGMLLAGMQDKFRNGLFPNSHEEYGKELLTNMQAYLLPFLALGSKMLYIDAMSPKKSSTTEGGQQHAIDRSPGAGVIWLSMLLLAVCLAGLISICVKGLISDGRWLENEQKDMISLSIGAFVFLSAFVAGAHRYTDDQSGQRGRQRRRVMMRIMLALLVFTIAFICSQKQTKTKQTSARITEVACWFAMSAPFFLGLLERVLDSNYSDGRPFQKGSSLAGLFDNMMYPCGFRKGNAPANSDTNIPWRVVDSSIKFHTSYDDVDSN